MKHQWLIITVVLGGGVGFAEAGCLHPKGVAPRVPDPQQATERQMMEARLKIEKYVAQAEGFAACAGRSSDKRAERTLKKAARLAEQYNRAHHQYQRRVVNSAAQTQPESTR